jgi:hypothetical protein
MNVTDKVKCHGGCGSLGSSGSDVSF